MPNIKNFTCVHRKNCILANIRKFFIYYGKKMIFLIDCLIYYLSKDRVSPRRGLLGGAFYPTLRSLCGVTKRTPLRGEETACGCFDSPTGGELKKIIQ